MQPDYTNTTKKINAEQIEHTQPTTHKNKKVVLRSVGTLLLMGTVACFILMHLNQQQKDIAEKQKENKKYQTTLQSLQKETGRLDNDRKLLTGSEEEILKYARKLYHFSGLDETIFAIDNDNQK
ncbi:septum formation initiator family protein [Bacillus thuringiensis]|uniref:FtsB family cell division protein n=1 Tax=Bacillus thuringiensis TaxID=1428 RepID=UPI002D7E8F52|nr:septum formation initiator family protein [Bacillus thuringiensis]MEB4816845.1 septum formation initiator family protein [Bacillus thuringiensis]